MKSLLRTLLRVAPRLALLVAVALIAREVVLQWRDDEVVRAEAGAVVRAAGAVTLRQRVLAIRDHIRARVTFHDAPVHDRPFLRATAAETLTSGQGYCGEVSRLFICMARAEGVHAQRINLYGSRPHTVAEVDLEDGSFIVDCQNPPSIAELERLDDVIQRPEYDDYSTVNLRRTGLEVVIKRLKLRVGPLTYWSENPHALKAAAMGGLLALLAAGWAARRVVRRLLRARGWVHVSNRAAVEAAAGGRPVGAPASGGAAEPPHGVGRPAG